MTRDNYKLGADARREIGYNSGKPHFTYEHHPQHCNKWVMRTVQMRFYPERKCTCGREKAQ